jgi:hypothetical protein
MQHYASDSQMFHIIKCRLCNAKYMQSNNLNSNSKQQCNWKENEEAALNETSASLGPTENVQVWRCNSNWIQGPKNSECINNQSNKDDNANKLSSNTAATENNNAKLARILCTWPYSQLEEINGEHQNG